jgi:putative chitinase
VFHLKAPRDNYQRCERALKLDLLSRPESLQEPSGAARSAAWFWFEAKLNDLADLKPNGNPQEDFIKICHRINGGAVGLQARLDYWEKTKRVPAAG